MSEERHYAVVGRSEGEPVLYHMNQTRAQAERLRARRAEMTGQPCYVVPMAQWHADPLGALRRAEARRTER